VDNAFGLGAGELRIDSESVCHLYFRITTLNIGFVSKLLTSSSSLETVLFASSIMAEDGRFLSWPFLSLMMS